MIIANSKHPLVEHTNTPANASKTDSRTWSVGTSICAAIASIWRWLVSLFKKSPISEIESHTYIELRDKTGTTEEQKILMALKEKIIPSISLEIHPEDLTDLLERIAIPKIGQQLLPLHLVNEALRKADSYRLLIMDNLGKEQVDPTSRKLRSQLVIYKQRLTEQKIFHETKQHLLREVRDTLKIGATTTTLSKLHQRVLAASKYVEKYHSRDKELQEALSKLEASILPSLKEVTPPDPAAEPPISTLQEVAPPAPPTAELTTHPFYLSSAALWIPGAILITRVAISIFI